MASKRQALTLLLLSLFAFSSIVVSSETTGGIAIYWGQNNGDGDLTTTCDTKKYEIVNLAFLNDFGCGREPGWNFAGHCGSWSPCTKLEPEIKHCQANGVKVFLSIGGAADYGDYSLCSTQDAKNVAAYLYENFLSSSKIGPLGNVTLDGIDFDIEKTEDYWDDLAKELDALRQPKKFYLSAAPQCPTDPIYYLGKAIATGVFDYVFVQFYNNPGCSYSNGNTGPLLQSWDKWISLVLPNNTVFMGLPASESAAGSGYIPPDVLISDVLPHIKQADNYGGVMLWDRNHDIPSDYSGKILPYVLKTVLQSMTAVSDAIFECVSAAVRRIFLPKAY